MTTMIPDLVVGAVGFGNTGEFYAGPEDATPALEALRAENRELIRRNNRLARALQLCATLSEEASNAKHEALLEHNSHEPTL